MGNTTYSQAPVNKILLVEKYYTRACGYYTNCIGCNGKSCGKQYINVYFYN